MVPESITVCDEDWGSEIAPLSEHARSTFASAMAHDGYAILPGALHENVIAPLVARIDDIAEQERAAETAWFSHGNQRLFNLVNKHEMFIDLVAHPIVVAIVELVIGPHSLLSSLTANIALPANEPQPLHADQGYLPHPWQRSEVVNIVYALDEFTSENGATRVVPGSHLWLGAEPEERAEAIPIVAPAGSIIALDGRVWHGTDRSKTARTPRRAIFGYYCRPYIRQQENFARSLRPELRRSLSPKLRTLLGFDIWMGLGSVNGLPTEWMDGRVRIGPSNPGFDE